MMSSIAVLLTAYLVTGPFKDPAAGLAGSPKVPDDTLLPVFNPEYGVGLDLVIGADRRRRARPGAHALGVGAEDP